MTDDVLRNRYKIKRQLGDRYDQETLLALDQTTNQLVVVKLLLFSHNFKWEKLKLFEREANTLRELDHPAIPRYIDYFDIETDVGKGFALVQSYIEAPSLLDHRKAGRTFSASELEQISKAILIVLIYLHNLYPPIIHRDIKPSNILLDNRSGNHIGDVYLVDFGSIQAAASEGGTRTIVGTYGYMAPEQFGERAVPASDLYSLGSTLIYLASGHHPADLPQRNLRICFENFVNLSPTFVNWLQWMTEPSLEQRLDSASQALEALENQTSRKKNSLVSVKPHNSKIILTKSHHRLDVHIPPRGFSLELLPRIGFAVVWNGFLVLWYSIAIAGWSSGGWLMALFALMHLGSGISMIIQILFILFRKIDLLLDQETIVLRHELCGFKYWLPHPAPRRHIIKLEKTHTMQITIWAGLRRFKIGGEDLLSEVELDWLASEIGDWLGLPIT